MEMKQHNYVFFWGGIFSNWYPSKFVIDEMEFNCVEQYMMYKKAMLFDDKETAKLIMETKSPRDQKALGRKVKNYDDAAWNKVRYEIVKEGARQKFEQNTVLKHGLLSYKGKEFVEASSQDNIWGIGFDEDHALGNESRWGTNLLGKLTTELSNELVYNDEDVFNLRLLNIKL